MFDECSFDCVVRKEHLVMETVLLIVKSIAELAAVILLIFGFVNENKMIKFERKVARVAAALVRERRRKKAIAKKKALAAQRHAVEYETGHKSSPVPERAYEERRKPQHPRRVA